MVAPKYVSRPRPLAIDVIDLFNRKADEHRAHVREHPEDLPEFGN